MALINALSIDVEDWFQVSAFASYIDRVQWPDMPCRVERNVDLLLELLAATDIVATFFTLGWIASRYPHLVRRIVENGHELANHGYAHQRASEQSQEQFRDDLLRSRSVLEDISGKRVDGYRAPSFSIGRTNPWAHDIIVDTGHRYSSSVFPVAHDHYGSPSAPRFTHRLPNGLLEIPPSTIRLAGRNWPVAGGGWFRLLPYRAYSWGLRRVNLIDRNPAVVYFHPWEFDPMQPRVKKASMRARFRHYLNLSRTETRFRQLLLDFRWSRIDRVFATELAEFETPSVTAAARIES